MFDSSSIHQSTGYYFGCCLVDIVSSSVQKITQIAKRCFQSILHVFYYASPVRLCSKITALPRIFMNQCIMLFCIIFGRHKDRELFPLASNASPYDIFKVPQLSDSDKQKIWLDSLKKVIGETEAHSKCEELFESNIMRGLRLRRCDAYLKIADPQEINQARLTVDESPKIEQARLKAHAQLVLKRLNELVVTERDKAHWPRLLCAASTQMVHDLLFFGMIGKRLGEYKYSLSSENLYIHMTLHRDKEGNIQSIDTVAGGALDCKRNRREKIPSVLSGKITYSLSVDAAGALQIGALHSHLSSSPPH